jgi:hypothetical protein
VAIKMAIQMMVMATIAFVDYFHSNVDLVLWYSDLGAVKFQFKSFPSKYAAREGLDCRSTRIVACRALNKCLL